MSLCLLCPFAYALLAETASPRDKTTFEVRNGSRMPSSLAFPSSFHVKALNRDPGTYRPISPYRRDAQERSHPQHQLALDAQREERERIKMLKATRVCIVRRR